MSGEDLEVLKKDVHQKKRIANDWASQIHDLVEDRLWSDYAKLPELAQQAHQACTDWAEAKKRLEQAGGSL